MSGGKVFFDTNVLLYMYGGTDSHKQARAKEVFRRYAASGRVLLSTQVVQEFYAAGSRKLAMPRHVLAQATAALLDSPLVIVGPAQIISAIETEDRYRVSFWDALILAAAESGGAEVLLTEDLNHGQQYGAVMVRNPFRDPEPR